MLLGDVAKVRDGFADQTNIVRVNGRRATYLAILKHADASTLAVVDAAQDGAAADQGRRRRRGWSSRSTSTSRCSCARRSSGVLREALIASVLVSLMILLFLGSWRSTVMVVHVDPAGDLRVDRGPAADRADAST